MRKKNKMGTVPPGTSGSYTPTKNLSFVAREFWGDTDDELVESYDGLFNEFGGDNYCISKNFLYLGITRGDDGCEPLMEESDEEYWDRSEDDLCPKNCQCDECTGQDFSLYDEDDGYDEDEEEKPADSVKTEYNEAVKETLELQEFFRRRAERERQEAEQKRKAESKPVKKTRHVCTEPPETEVVEVWQMRQVAHSSGGAEGSTVRPGKNSRRPWIGDRGGDTRFDYDPAMVLAEVIVNNRRYRVGRVV